MRQWLEAGYFKGNLPISQDPKGQFRPLSTLFPDLSVAFKPTGPSNAELEALAKAEAEKRRAAAQAEAAERERIEKEQYLKQKKAEDAAAAAAALKAAEAMRVEQESQTNQQQSAQLKMLLGLGGGSSLKMSTTTNEPSKNTSVQQAEQQTQSKAPEPKESNSNKSNNVAAPLAQAQPAHVPAQPPTPAWGGAGTNKPTVQRKSMSEIQQEEARAAAKMAKQKSQSSGGWANIAASGGTTAWSGNAAVITTSPATVPSVSLAQSTTATSRSKQSVSGTSTQKATNQTSTQKTMEEFGANGKMNPALESWCKDQMRKLSGSDDLTLIAFCMTLSDAVEIKGYLTAYLGSSSQVNNFATEFINRKNGTKQQEQWETTGGSKKGRKKKGASAK